MAIKSNNPVVELKPIDIRTVHLRIHGTAPLIMHKWSEKAKKMILDTQTKSADAKKKAKPPKNPVEDFITSAYWMSGEPKEYTTEAFEEAIANGARFGFPAVAFKQAAISAAYRAGVVSSMAALRGAFFIKGEGERQLVEIKGDAPHPREDMVRVGMGTADIRYRAQFEEWYADLEITYNASGMYSLEQLVSIFQLGGFANGIGEWRPERDGTYGTFSIETMPAGE